MLKTKVAKNLVVTNIPFIIFQANVYYIAENTRKIKWLALNVAKTKQLQVRNANQFIKKHIDFGQYDFKCYFWVFILSIMACAPDMVLKLDNSQKCHGTDCSKWPVYNLPGEKIPMYCSKHKTSEMVNVKNKICIEYNCKTCATFNVPGKRKELYCYKHKENGMVNVRNKLCIEVDCSAIAIYNKSGEKGGLYCNKHKKSEMLNAVSNRCIESGCSTFPSYNVPGGKRLYCFKHKTSEMINVASKRCIETGCDKIPSFNMPGQRKKLYCAEHKKFKMIRTRRKNKTIAGKKRKNAEV